MDLIAMRFEARHLEVEGKLPEALDVCRDILRHFSHEPPTEQLLPVFVQASDLSITLGDREGGATLLLVAAERYADAGLARAVIDLYQRLRRLGPARHGLDLQFARRMLEHRHPGAAREFLAELARRQKKERLSATLDRMAAWSDDKVQQQLLDFLDRAEGIRESAAEPRPSAATATAVPPDAGAVSPPPPPPPVPVPPPAPPAVMPAEAVVFVTPAAPREDQPARPSGPRTARAPIVPPPRRRGRSRGRVAAAVGVTVVLLAAGAALLVPRLRRDVPTVAISPPPSPVELAPPAPASPIPADPAQALSGDSAGVAVAVDSVPPSAAPPPAPTPRAQPARTDSPPADSVRPPVAAPQPVPEPVAAPPTSGLPFGVTYPVVIVEGLEIVGITREGEGSAGRILVRQLLPSGDTLELRESDLGEASIGVGAGRVLVGRHPAGGSMGTVRIGRYLVSARAPVDPDVLEPWLQRLVEKAPG